MPQVKLIHDSANALVEAGYKILPLRPGTKVPAADNWPEFELGNADFAKLFQDHNLGVITGKRSRVAVLDFDEKQAGRDFYAKHRDILKTIVETRKGVHFWFQYSGPVGNGKHKYGDIRGDGGQVVAPVSTVGEWTYRFVEGHGLVVPEELPLFDPSLVEAARAKVSLRREQVTRLDAYLAKIESVQGQYGSCGLMRACYVCRDAGLNEAETMLRLVRWNQNAQPPWNDAELARAVTNAFERKTNA